MEGLIRPTLLLAGLLMVAGPVTADEPQSDVKVERTKVSGKQKQTLRFLRDNRDFLRAQLDRLRQIRVERDGELAMLSERHLMFQRMLEEILAAQDTVASEQLRVDQLTLLDSVRELGDLEAQLDLMEELLGEQSQRLVELESDFVGRQQTALLILLRGYPESGGPQALILETDDGARIHITLGTQEAEALRRGGIAQVYHEFVEPRQQVLSIFLEGDGYASAPQTLELDPARDRVNFLQLDLATLTSDDTATQIPVSRWAK